MQYEPIQPGELYRLHTPAGPLSIPTTEEDLIAAGHTPLTAPGSQALAMNDAVPPAGAAFGGDDAQMADWIRGAPARDDRAALVAELKKGAAPMAHEAPRAAAPASTFDQLSAIKTTPIASEEEKGKAPLRGDAQRVSIPDRQPAAAAGQSAPRARVVKGGDTRIGYKVEKTALNPEDAQAAEDAEADASIDRKLSAQNIAERKATASEAQSAAMGRDIRREELAIEAQRQRNDAMRADFADRQGAIDRERDAVDNLKVNPREYVGSQPAWARIVSAISVLGGGLASAYNGGRNPAMEAINQEIERNIDAQKSQIANRRQGLASRENELERLTKIYGSPDAAEAELRDRQRSLIQNYAIKQAVDAGALDAADNLRTQFADWDSQRAKDRLARQGALAGNVQETWANLPDRVVGGAPAVKESDIHQLSADEEKAGIGSEQADLGKITDLIHSLPEGEVPTVGSRNVVSRAVRAAADFLGGTGTSAKFDSAAEHAAATKVEQIRGQLRHQLSGAAVSPTEAPILERQLQDLNTKEGLLSFASDLQRRNQRHQAGIRAGSRPEVVQEYERRKGAYNVRSAPSSTRAE